MAATLATTLIGATPLFADADIVLNNTDAPGVGFNSPAPRSPVGGNPGTTLGEQLLNVAQFAADTWGGILESDTPIIVQVVTQPLGCDSTSGALGFASTLQIFSDFVGAPLPGTWYAGALANALAGQDLTPGPPDPGFRQEPFNDDIAVAINSEIGTTSCLGGIPFYLGLDNNAVGSIDLLNVLMHEIAHGLGFTKFVNTGTGSFPAGLPDIYTVFTLDTTLGRHWSEMTASERLASTVNTGNVVWDGSNVTANAAVFLDGAPVLRITSPSGIAGDYQSQPAEFGPPLNAAGVTGEIELAFDGVGSTGDACQLLSNNFQGRIALVERGTCTFVTKVANAQAAGAGAVIVVNNEPFGLPPMGGDSASIVIPSVGISLDDGLLIDANLPVVVGTLVVDPGRLAGTNLDGLVRLFAPSPAEGGSSISHWDTSLTPDALMEPSLSGSLRAGTRQDLTTFLLLDLGWNLDADDDDDGVLDVDDNCPDAANPGQTDFDQDGRGDACEFGASLADADLSGRVDGFDLSLLALAFGSLTPDPLYNINVDYDRDGDVDGDDLALLAASFGDSVLQGEQP